MNIPQIPNKVSTVNSSTTTLLASAVFTGTSEDISQYQNISVYIFSDQASATDGLSVQQSSNGTNWDITDVYTIPASTGKTFTIGITGQFFRIIYTNGGVNQTSFRLQTIFHTYDQKPSSVRPQDARINDNDFEENLSYLMGFNGTTWDRLRTTGTGILSTAVSSALPVGANVIGKVSIDQTTPGTTNLVSLTAETTKVIGTVNIAALQTLATVSTVTAVTAITNALPAGSNKLGTVDIATAPATAKGTQGTNAVPTQDLKDAGRNQVHYYTLIPVLSSATDTLQSLTGTKAGATVIATTTPAVVTTGKTLRITRLAATYIATATSGYGMVRLRFNTAGVVAITSPIAATLVVGAGTPATANSMGSYEATLDEGWEFAAATGIGISVQGFAAVTPTAVGYVLVSVTGYEY